MNRKKLTKLTHHLQNNFDIQGKPLSKTEIKIIEKAITLAKYTTLFYFASLSISVIVMVLTPPTMFLIAQLTNSTTTSKLLIWKIWLPFDCSEPPLNVMVYVFEAIATIYTGCSIIGAVNAFFLCLIIYTSCQFELLSASIRSAIHSSKTQETKSYVRNCILYHQKLFK